MPKPTSKEGRLRRDIAESMEEYDLQANNEKMIATKLLPVHESAVDSANFGRIPLKELLAEKETSRASAGSYGRHDWGTEKHVFATAENGWEVPAPERDTRLYGDFFEVELVSAEIARSTVLINQEKRAAKTLFDNGDVQTQARIAPWTDYAAADPIKDVNNAILAVWERTGLWPNALVLSHLLYRHLKECEVILDRITANGAGDRALASDVNAQKLAQVFDVEEVMIAGASTNTANQGQAAKVAQIWDSTKCGVVRVPRTKNVREPGFGRTFHWAEDGSKIGTVMESYWEEDKRSEIQRARCETDENVIYPEAAQVIENLFE